MADWNASNITLTAKGSSALSRVEAGDGSLTITRVVASEQYVQESTLREVTTLSVENLELTIIDRHEVEDGGSVIQAQLSNLNLTKKFTLNEIGVFATHSSDPDNEFLYIIAQVDLNTGDEIPLYSVTPVTATYDIYLYNVGADKVNVTISSAGLVTYEALNAICGLAQRNTAYELGQIANHASLPTGMYLECVVAGTTASIPISLPASPKEGDMVKDGSVTWVLSKAPSSRKLGYLQPSTAYTVGNIAYHSALPTGWCLECTTAGISGTSAVVLPDPLVDGATITDGTITWTLRKLATNGALGYRQPSTSYALGAVAHNAGLPTGTYLECTTAGETGSGELTITSPTVGGTVSDGTVTWTVRKNASTQDLTGYLPLRGGAMTGSDITRNVDNSALSLRGGSDYEKGGSLELYGKDYDITDITGAFRLIAKKDAYVRYLTGTPAGDLTWDGNSLDKSAVVAESLGVNGYRKYASGLIEQWGKVDVEAGTYENTFSFPITFPTAVSSILAVQYSDKTAGLFTCAVHSDNLSSFILQYTPAPSIVITFSWHAKGY